MEEDMDIKDVMPREIVLGRKADWPSWEWIPLKRTHDNRWLIWDWAEAEWGEWAYEPAVVAPLPAAEPDQGSERMSSYTCGNCSWEGDREEMITEMDGTKVCPHCQQKEPEECPDCATLNHDLARVKAERDEAMDLVVEKDDLMGEFNVANVDLENERDELRREAARDEQRAEEMQGMLADARAEVARLREVVKNLPCYAARPGEGTLECRELCPACEAHALLGEAAK